MHLPPTFSDIWNVASPLSPGSGDSVDAVDRSVLLETLRDLATFPGLFGL